MEQVKRRCICAGIQFANTLETVYTSMPIILADPVETEALPTAFDYAIENLTLTGFTIKINAIQATDIEFSLIAVATAIILQDN